LNTEVVHYISFNENSEKEKGKKEKKKKNKIIYNRSEKELKKIRLPGKKIVLVVEVVFSIFLMKKIFYLFFIF